MPVHVPPRCLASGAAAGEDARRSAGGGQADQGGAAGSHRRLGPHPRGGLRRRRAADEDRGRGDYCRAGPGRDDLAGHRLRRYRGRHGDRGGASAAAPAWLPGRARALRPGTSPALDRDIVRYVDSNNFFENYRGPADDFFGSVGSKPEIYPVYWSPTQMQARQDDRMAQVQRFLNRLWKHESEGAQWFDPNRDSLYPDRIRRRPEGADSAGLGTHLDPGNLDLWMTRAHQKAFRHLFDGTIEQYDPWDAAYRTAGPQYPGTTMCSAFRTFQGWTALSDMAHDQACCTPSRSPEPWPTSCCAPAGRRARRRHVRGHRQPDLPRQCPVARCSCWPSAAYPTSGPATPFGGTAT